MLPCLGQCEAGNGHGMYRLKIGGLVRDPLLKSQSNKSTLNPLLKTLIYKDIQYTHTLIGGTYQEAAQKKALRK